MTGSPYPAESELKGWLEDVCVGGRINIAKFKAFPQRRKVR